MNNLKKIIEACNIDKKQIYNILTFPTHERYESQLCKTGHNFYSFHIPNGKKWNAKQVNVPSNYHILPEANPCHYLNYDFILVQSKYWQFQVAQQLNQFLKLPIICLEHTLPTPLVTKKSDIENMKMMVGDFNVFISEYSRSEWEIQNNTRIIHHGIDTEVFKPNGVEKQSHILTVANDFIKRNYCLNYEGFCRVTDGLDRKIIGETEGLSQSASSTEELVNEYNSCAVYFNSTTLSPIPTSLLEAMSCGCAVVSTATCMIPNIIEHGVNGFISNNENELKSYLLSLQKDSELRNKIGTNARQTIIEKFSQDDFISSWNKIFKETYEVTIS
jgi:glycosyltransferase involved in cell wall biosynthesis